MTDRIGYRKGRKWVHRPRHPLADRKGWVPEHRVVAYRAWGPNERACHWCGRWLAWEGNVNRIDTIAVDHLDGDITNNRPGNLVPSCTTCNLHRGRSPWICFARACLELSSGRHSRSRRAEILEAHARSLATLLAAYRPDPLDELHRRPEPPRPTTGLAQ